MQNEEFFKYSSRISRNTYVPENLVLTTHVQKPFSNILERNDKNSINPYRTHFKHDNTPTSEYLDTRRRDNSSKSACNATTYLKILVNYLEKFSISASTLFFQIVFPKDQTFTFDKNNLSSRLAFSRIAPWLGQLSKGARRQWEESVGSGPSGSRGGWCKHAGRGWMGNGRNKASYYQQMVDYIDPPSFLPSFLLFSFFRRPVARPLLSPRGHPPSARL